MFDKIEIGIDFEHMFSERLHHILSEELPEVMHLDYRILPESGRVAAKDKFTIGDILFHTDHTTCLIDCTSSHTRSDNRLVTRLKTQNKDISEMYNYINILNTYADYNGMINKDKIPVAILKKYQNIRFELYRYLDKTFGLSGNMIIETEEPGMTDAELYSYVDGKGRFDGEAYNKVARLCSVGIRYDRGFWWGSVQFKGALAYEYGGDIIVTILSDATNPILSKANPQVDDLLSMSFNLYGFALWLYSGCHDFSQIGNLECDLDHINQIITAY